MASAAKVWATRSVVRGTLNLGSIPVSKKPNYRDVDTLRKLCHLCQQLIGRRKGGSPMADLIDDL